MITIVHLNNLFLLMESKTSFMNKTNSNQRFSLYLNKKSHGIIYAKK